MMNLYIWDDSRQPFSFYAEMQLLSRSMCAF